MHNKRFNIIVVGCGGTGGNYLKELGRYLYSLPNKHNHKVIIIDNDVIEERNLIRQPFQREDINKKKSEVMSEILSQIFDLECHYVSSYIDTTNDLKKCIDLNYINILIGAVDNHACRAIMHKVFIKEKNIIYLDSANGLYNGEIVVGARLDDLTIYPDRPFYYPEVLTDKEPPRSRRSCTALQEEEPQHLVTNIMAANILLTNTVSIISDSKIKGGIYLFNLQNGYMRYRPYSKTNFVID